MLNETCYELVITKLVKYKKKYIKLLKFLWLSTWHFENIMYNYAAGYAATYLPIYVAHNNIYVINFFFNRRILYRL